MSENVSKGETERSDKVSDQKGIQRDQKMVKSNYTQTKVCDMICVQTVDEKVLTPSSKIEQCSHVNTNKLCHNPSQSVAANKVETIAKCLVTNITERDRQVLDEGERYIVSRQRGKGNHVSRKVN